MKKIKKCCATCKWHGALYLTQAGRVKRNSGTTCEYVVPWPAVLPDSITQAWSFALPKPKGWMPAMNEGNCPCWEAHQ